MSESPGAEKLFLAESPGSADPSRDPLVPQLPKLSPAHEAIASAYITPGTPAFLNQSQAYKKVRPRVSKGMARVGGHRVLTNANTQAWVRAKLSGGGLTKEKIVEDIASIADRAAKEGKLDTQLAASVSLLKARGEWTEKREVTTLSDQEKDEARRLVSDLLRNPN